MTGKNLIFSLGIFLAAFPKCEIYSCYPFIFTLTNISCAQHKNNLKPVEDKWLNMYKTIKSTVEKPLYYLDVQNNECTFQILINDVPALTAMRRLTSMAVCSRFQI